MRNIIVLFFLVLSSCGHVYETPRGISYVVVNLNNDHEPDGDLISPAQIDAAWTASEHLWGQGDPRRVMVKFWGTPVPYGQKLYAGGTYGTEINVYLEHGDEGCLFLVGNEGALVHEMGHALQYEHGLTYGDPDHTAPQWEWVGGVRERLDLNWCTVAPRIGAFLQSNAQHSGDTIDPKFGIPGNNASIQRGGDDAAYRR